MSSPIRDGGGPAIFVMLALLALVTITILAAVTAAPTWCPNSPTLLSAAVRGCR